MNIDQDQVKAALKEGPVIIDFIKRDGTPRSLACTLKPAVIAPYEKKTDRVKAPNPDVLSVWDIDNDSWRSFRWDSITNVQFTTKA